MDIAKLKNKLLNINQEKPKTKNNQKKKTNTKKISKKTEPEKKSDNKENEAKKKIVARANARTISRLEDMPKHDRILSKEGGAVDIGTEMRKNYIVLLIKPDQKIVDVVRSTESFKAKGVDQNFLEVKRQIESSGFVYKSDYFASKPLIKLIYDKSSKNDKSKNFIENASDLTRDFESLLEEAILEGVSDIHIEVRRDDAIVRMRINGKLQHKYEWDVQYSRDLAVVIYQVLAEEKDVVFIPSQPQDAVIDRVLPIGRVRVRLATSPAYPDGFDVVMRLLPMGVATKVKKLTDLGYMPEQAEVIDKMTDRPVGAIIISGVTGSGKSTSMATMLATKINENQGKIKVITVENPPENAIPGATQVPVVLSREGKSGKSPFAAAIKSAMRSDPDVLMVGEVRDEDTADLLVHATQSGHQTITTLHAPSAFAIPSRLRSLGVDNDVLGSGDFLAGMIYQTLVPTLCEHCSIPFKEFEKNKLSDKQKSTIKRIRKISSEEQLDAIRFKNDDGCKKCEGGITGRTVVAETVFPDDDMKAMFSSVKDNDAKRYFVRNGELTVLQAGIVKLNQGIVDAFDLEHKVGRLDEVLLYDEYKED